MDDIKEFYNIITPLVPDNKFCVDKNILTNTEHNHPECSSCPEKFSAGIKRENGKIKKFITKEEDKVLKEKQKKTINSRNKYLFGLIILSILYIKIIKNKNRNILSL